MQRAESRIFTGHDAEPHVFRKKESSSLFGIYIIEKKHGDSALETPLAGRGREGNYF
jgi:hypothetical protein